MIYLWLPEVGRMVVETGIDPDSFNLGSDIRCEGGESGEHLLDIGAEEVAANFHPRVADAGAVEGPLVQVGVVMSQGVEKVAAVNVILVPAQLIMSRQNKTEQNTKLYQSVS